MGQLPEKSLVGKPEYEFQNLKNLEGSEQRVGQDRERWFSQLCAPEPGVTSE